MKHEILWKKNRRFEIREKHVMNSLQGCGWHVAEAEISSAYRSFSNEKIMGKLGIYIGIDHVNVTLLAMPSKKIFLTYIIFFITCQQRILNSESANLFHIYQHFILSILI